VLGRRASHPSRLHLPGQLRAPRPRCSLTWRVELTPKREGTLQTPIVQLTSNGRTWRSNSDTVKVSSSQSGETLKLELRSQPPNPWVGQASTNGFLATHQARRRAQLPATTTTPGLALPAKIQQQTTPQWIPTARDGA
jgi:hypothetical protein